MPPGFTSEVVCTPTHSGRWRIEKPLSYHTEVEGKPADLVVPEGFKTGFSLVPGYYRWRVGLNHPAFAAVVLYTWLRKETEVPPERVMAIRDEALGLIRLGPVARWVLRRMR